MCLIATIRPVGEVAHASPIFPSSYSIMNYSNQSNFMAKAIGTVRATDTNVKGHVLRASSGSGMTFTKARGLGKCMVKDLDGVIARAKLQYKLDRMAMVRQGSAT